MFRITQKLYLATLGILFIMSGFLFTACTKNQTQNLPKIAIASWGPHASLDDTIKGIKDELARLGLKENVDFTYTISHVNFESSLVLQMLAKLKADHPKVLVAISTPVAQAAKNMFKDTPIIFADITDPIEAGLLTQYDQSQGNITGASDRQNLGIFLDFVRKILPHAKTIGILYATGEANDAALVKMMQQAGAIHGMEVLALPIEQSRDIPLTMQAFKDKADFIYVGVSGPVQPSLPVIVAEAEKMHIPVFNADSAAVKNHQVLGSFGVTYYQVGVQAAHMIFDVFKGKDIKDIPPYYPQVGDHQGFISQKRADKFGITVPALPNVTVVN